MTPVRRGHRVAWGWGVAAALWAAGPAWAQDTDADAAGDAATAAPPSADEVVERPGEVVVIYGEALVEQARQAVISEAAAQGYTDAIRRDDRLVLRHPTVWKGEIVLFDDGRVTLKRQPVQFKPPGDKPASWLWCIFLPACVRAGGQVVSPRKLHAVEREVLEAIQPDVQGWSEAIADVGLERKLDELPPRLEALWGAGAPLEPDEAPLPTFEARRRALLDFWDSRTNTDWGEAVRRAVEGFVRAEVMTSDHPFTRAELAAFEARRQALRRPDFGPLPP